MKLLVLGMAIMCAAKPAAALMECEFVDALVAEAVMVVQLTNTAVTPRDAEGFCTVTGDIAQVFLGELPVGTRIMTTLPCSRDADENNPQPDYGSPLQSALEAALVLELHIAAQGGVAGSGEGAVLLDALTDAPAYTSACPG